VSDWKAFEIKIPGKDLLESVRGILETLLIFLEILKAILQTIQMFLIDFGNPLRALIEALLKLILQLFESLKRTGLYGYFDVPNPTIDPNFDRFRGGYQAFTERFKASLFDSKDPFRPQPAPGINKSGFVIIVADAESVFGMLRLLAILLRFFGKDSIAPQYPAPSNLKVFPAGKKPGALGGESIDPILQVASVFGAKLEGLAVEWSLATNQFPPDPGFSDILPTISSELIPQKWLIEKTSVAGGPPTKVIEDETRFEDKKGKRVKRKKQIRDEHGDFWREFEQYIVIDPTQNTSTFLLGQLGKFRYIDTDVTEDTTYYYRVRAFSGSLDVSGTSLNLKDPETPQNGGESIQKWPSTDTNDPAIMGRPSGITTGRVPKSVPADFDVIAVLNATFRAAFALGFHLEASPDATFDEEGVNTGDTPVAQVGRGSLLNLAGPLGRIVPNLNFGALGGVQGGQGTDVPDDTPVDNPDVTYNYFSVKAQAARLTNGVAATLLENSGMLTSLRDLYKSLPKAISGGKGYLESVSSIEELVINFTKVPDDFPEKYHRLVYQTYSFAYTSLEVRLNVLNAVRFLKSFTLGGVPPDWVSISLLRDIIPFSGQFIYELLARIDALLEAFKSALDEIKAFIDLLIRKIDVLERFIKFLIEILNYLDSFSAGFYFLSVPDTDGGIPAWIQAIDTAGGTKPPSGPGGYTGGVALAYSGPNVEAFATAFSLIF